MKFIYPAIFRRTEEGSYMAEFPDLEGCRASAATLDEAVMEAHEAALDWITLELEDLGEDDLLPPVTDPADLHVGPGEVVRNICVTIRMYEGWDE